MSTGRTESAKRGRVAALAALVLCCASALADRGSLVLSSYPSLGVADARSTMTVNVEVRDQRGNAVPNGTQVVLTATQGVFRQSVVTTTNGIARGILVAPSSPGKSTITASCLAFDASALMELEFVADRSLLASAKDYIEIVSATHLQYAPEFRIVSAAGKDRGVKLKYRDIEIDADRLQLNATGYEVRAWRVRVRIGREVQEFDQLNFRLNTRRGTGLRSKEATEWKVAGKAPFLTAVPLTVNDPEVFEITATGTAKTNAPLAPNFFQLEEVGDAVTVITSKKAVVFPGKELHFHRAEVSVGGQRVMRMPLYQISAQVATPVISDQFLNVSNSQLSLNYPHYLSLRPGETSLLRFRTGTRYSRGVGAGGGTFLDYELHWNKGNDADGNLTISGLARKDWGASLRHYHRLDDFSSATAQLDFPANSSIYGSFNINRQFKGFSTSYDANAARNVRGIRFRSSQQFLSIDKDPMQLGKHFRMYLGLAVSESNYNAAGIRSRQQSYGLRSQIQSSPFQLSRGTSLTTSLSLSHLKGVNVKNGITTGGTATLSSNVNRNLSMFITYDYLDDGFNAAVVGRHRMSTQAYWNQGPFTLSMFGSRSLDKDRLSGYFDLGYRLNSTWRILSTYTFDRYNGLSYSDYSLVLGYKLGFREIGLSWSGKTKRFGVEILGASFN